MTNSSNRATPSPPKAMSEMVAETMLPGTKFTAHNTCAQNGGKDFCMNGNDEFKIPDEAEFVALLAIGHFKEPDKNFYGDRPSRKLFSPKNTVVSGRGMESNQ